MSGVVKPLNPLRVTFVLPGASAVPTGGARMVFRYANELVKSGWVVQVVMPAGGETSSGWRLIKDRRSFIWRKLTGTWTPNRWMDIDPRITLTWVRNLSPQWAPVGDVVVATAVQTAEAVAAWSSRAGRKYYFVQGYETWDWPVARVEDSWRLPMQKIAVSKWLCGLIEDAGGKAFYLPNGVDDAAFGLDNPPEQRVADSLIWPYHRNVNKGGADVRGAISLLVETKRALQVTAYGLTEGPKKLPITVTYWRNPLQKNIRKLYNSSAIAVAPSYSEGWGLPACEALQCGCALAASDVGGHREFLRDGHNALLHQPGDVKTLYHNIYRLISDSNLRMGLVRQGLLDMAQLRFAPMVERLKFILAGEAGIHD